MVNVDPLPSEVGGLQRRKADQGWSALPAYNDEMDVWGHTLLPAVQRRFVLGGAHLAQESHLRNGVERFRRSRTPSQSEGWLTTL